DILITNNTITGNAVHGVHFGGIVGNESQIWILDNTSIIGQQDGIHFAGAINSDEATIDIIGNQHIEGRNDDGIDFNGMITDATIRINDNDNIEAGGNGIEFAGVSGATVEILNNNHGIHA